MDNVRTIYLDWNTGAVKCEGGGYLARQYDHLSNLVIFQNAPKLENYYLIVEMKEQEDDITAREMAPIQLSGPYWLIPNVYTQLVQTIKFQVCCRAETGDYERHSARYTFNVIESMGHDGSELDVDPSVMFDPYKEYVDRRDETVLQAARDVAESEAGIAAQEWLDDHPEAIAVQDGAITESKFSASVKKTVDASKIRDLAIDSVAFMKFYKANYTSLQGICALDEQHIVVVRCLSDNSKSFSVWNINTRTLINESIFTDEQVGHCNTITYDGTYIYVTTLLSGKYVTKLRVDATTKAITYDSIVYDGSIYMNCVAYANGHFYCFTKSNGVFTLRMTDNFQTFSTLATSTFDDVQYLTPQGMAVHNGFVFITFSTSTRTAVGEVTGERLPLMNEAVYVTDTELNVLKTSLTPRGKYGEIEDCDVIVVNSQPYLLIGTNQNDLGVSCVHALPIFNNTERLEVFHELYTFDGLYNHDGQLVLYVDSSAVSPFARGTKTDPFNSVHVAMLVIRQVNCVAVLNVTGTFSLITFRNLTNPIIVKLNNVVVNDLGVSYSSNVFFDCTDATLGHLNIEGSTVEIRTGISIEPMDETVQSGISLYRSFLTANINSLGAFNWGISTYTSIANVRIVTDETTTTVNKVTASLICVNNVIA